MTIPSTLRKAGPFIGTGAQTVFPVAFKVFAEADLVVTITDEDGAESTGVLDTDYSVSLNASQDVSPGGTVTYPISGTALATDERLTITCGIDLDQPLDIPGGGNFNPQAIENELDRIVMQIHQGHEMSSRAVRFPVSDDASLSPVLPTAALRADMLAGFDSDGNITAVAPVAQSATALQILLAAIGATLIGFIQSGIGAVLRTIENKMRDKAHIFDYMTLAEIADVQSGAPVMDHTAKILLAHAARLEIDYGDADNWFRLSSSVTLRNYAKMKGSGALIQQITAQTVSYYATSRTGVHIDGLRFRGFKTDYVDSSSSLAIAIKAFSSINLRVTNCYFTDFAYSALYGESVVDAGFINNTVIGPGLTVLTPGVSRNCTGVTLGGTGLHVTDNDVSETGQGVIIAQGSTNYVVGRNLFWNIRVEHGAYIDTGCVNGVVNANVLQNCYQNGIKAQWYDSLGLTPRNLAVTNNVVDGTTTGDCFIANNTTAGVGTIYMRGLVVTGNVFKGAGQDGMNVRYVWGGLIANNYIISPTRHAINEFSLLNVTVRDNQSELAGENGIFMSGVVGSLHHINNTIYSPGQAGQTANGRDSAVFGATTSESDVIFSGTRIFGDVAKTQYGIYLSSGDLSKFRIEKTFCSGIYGYGLRLAAAANMGGYSDNEWAGVLGVTFNQPTLPVIASAATITIPQSGNAFFVSGTTGITTIVVAGTAGRRISLIFQDVLTVTDGSNLRLNGNMVTTANDVLPLLSDGIQWYEDGARSAN
jgi:hypothetical protein